MPNSKINEQLVKYHQLKVGQYFVVQNKPGFPKKRLPDLPNGDPGGYFDFQFEVRHLMPNPEWIVMPYTEAETIAVLQFTCEGDMEKVNAKLEKVKQYEN